MSHGACPVLPRPFPLPFTHTWCSHTSHVTLARLAGAVTQRVWSNSFFNFDNLGHALVILFVFANQDSFTDLLSLAMSTRQPDQQPVPGANNWAVLYFIAFIYIVGFCMMNMYVG